jgi:hypothetical protein
MKVGFFDVGVKVVGGGVGMEVGMDVGFDVGMKVGSDVVGWDVGMKVGTDVGVDVGLDVVGDADETVEGGLLTQVPNVLVSLRRKVPPAAITIPSTTIVYEPSPKLQQMPSPKLSLIVN